MKTINFLIKNKLAVMIVALTLVGGAVLMNATADNSDAPTGSMSIIITEKATGDSQEFLITIEDLSTSQTIFKPSYAPLTTFDVDVPPVDLNGEYEIEFFLDVLVDVETPGDITEGELTGSISGYYMYGDDQRNFIIPNGVTQGLIENVPYTIGQNSQIEFSKNNSQYFDGVNYAGMDHPLNGFMLDNSMFNIDLTSMIGTSEATTNAQIQIHVGSVGEITIDIVDISMSATDTSP